MSSLCSSCTKTIMQHHFIMQTSTHSSNKRLPRAWENQPLIFPLGGKPNKGNYSFENKLPCLARFIMTIFACLIRRQTLCYNAASWFNIKLLISISRNIFLSPGKLLSSFLDVFFFFRIFPVCFRCFLFPSFKIMTREIRKVLQRTILLKTQASSNL